MEQLFGFIERITYHNNENGFTVAKLKAPRKNDLITLVGKFGSLQPGESVRCEGHWKINPSHGMQFEVEHCHMEAPADLVGIRKYLSSGLIKGIGPTYAKRIVEAFGLQTLEILDHHPEKLREIDGIGEKRTEKIIQCWQEQKTIREIMLFLSRYEISPTYAQKIYKVYGNECIEILKENPFAISKHIPGIGFKKADAIAEKMGISKDAIQRMDAGIEFLITESAGEGNTCISKQQLIKKAHELLENSPLHIEERIPILHESGALIEKLKKEEPYIWTKGLYICEQGIVAEITRIKESRSSLRSIDTESALQWVEAHLKIQLAEAQKNAIKEACSEKVYIITGGPGTGKSTIIKSILAITKKLTRKIILAAPTGRAAKRMQEITYFQASTIHSLLSYDFIAKKFRFNRENPVDGDLIIIDEASMIDTPLMYHLLKAIPSHARLIFVGDVHQLPSVGPGQVLRDLIECQKIPLTTLTKIFRQASGSQIIVNAHRINQGEVPFLKNDRRSDFFFLLAESPQDVVSKILELVSERLPKSYHFDPIEHIQVLSPMKRGLIGTENLNLMLQDKLNPREEKIFYGGNRFSIHDKVMQIRNNYQKEIFNGDIGKIQQIDHESREIQVSFDGKLVPYSLDELDELTLAYATSIHKYQGSESPCVVIPIHSHHYPMLSRNLLYTGVTRGKKMVVIVGTPKAIGIAVSNEKAHKRETGLLDFLAKQETL